MKAARQGRSHTPEERMLKARAKELGINYHPRMGAERLRQLIAEHMQELAGDPTSSLEEAQAQEAQVLVEMAQQPSQEALKGLYMTEEEYHKKRFGEEKRNAGRLVRIRLTCMNPNKKNWTGEIFSVGSAKLGTHKKFIPYNMEEPYHVPWIIYQELKNRKCVVRSTSKDLNGRDVTKSKLINEFAIELLPPLTVQELQELKQRQAMERGKAA